MAFIKFILVLVIVVVALVWFTLYRNEAHLFQPPGIAQRLPVFLKTNVAETADDHKFEELRTPTFDINAEELFKRVLDEAAILRWEIIAHDSDNQNVNIVVRSPVFLFEDDFFVQVNFIDMETSSLYIRSSSRKGRGDLAANSAHIQTLIQKLRD